MIIVRMSSLNSNITGLVSMRVNGCRDEMAVVSCHQHHSLQEQQHQTQTLSSTSVALCVTE